MTFLIQQTLIFAVPLMIVALAGVFSERSGIINLALEGLMIFGAFIGVMFFSSFICVFSFFAYCTTLGLFRQLRTTLKTSWLARFGSRSEPHQTIGSLTNPVNQVQSTVNGEIERV